MSVSPARYFLLVFVACLALLLLPGCVVDATDAGKGAAAVAYVRGDLQTTLGKGQEAATAATRLAIKELEFAKISESAGADATVIVARTAVDKKVEITLTDAGKNLTGIKIRVGVFGDEQLSLAILEKIKAVR